MFEVGKFYESNNGDKLLCRGHDESDKTWLFCGVGKYGYIVIWCFADGRLFNYKCLGPIIKGPWTEKEGSE